MIVKRNLQMITSKWGKRKGFRFFHFGVDLRSYTDDPRDSSKAIQPKLPIVLPEDCILLRKVYQKRWGWTFVFEPLESYEKGYRELKFTHMQENNNIYEDGVYKKDHNIGFTGVTAYMIKKNYGDHLHFATKKKTLCNPIEYFNLRNEKYVYKG
jgi:hypothetical protein